MNKQLYNSCVHYATNGSIYGYDWFLNATAKDWDFLVEGDDSWVSVMPLPRATNWAGDSFLSGTPLGTLLEKTYLEQPRLIPELAVYTVKPLSPKRIQAFWDAIPAEYTRGGLTVEPASVPKNSGRFDVRAAPGTVLFLNQPYEEIIGDFSPAYHEGLLRAEDAGLNPGSVFKPEIFADLWLEVNGKGGDNEWRYHAMQRIMYQILHRSWGGTRAVVSPAGKPLALLFLCYNHSRISPLFSVETAEGKRLGAMTYLWDNLLKTHADRNLKVRREDVPA